MSSPRSQSPSKLDPQLSHYTPAQHKRKSTSTPSPEDDTTEVTAQRKKKRSKKERRHNDPSDYHYNGHDVAPSSPPLPPVQKLPTIKISLRLPANPAIIPSSSSSSTHKSSSSSSKKKRRSSEQLAVVSEDDEHEYKDQDKNEDEDNYSHKLYHSSGDEHQDRRSSSHKKKKKHKHKHKHRHRMHEGHGGEDDENNETGSVTPKITLRLGKEKKEEKSWNSSSPHGIHPNHHTDKTSQPEMGDQQKASSRGNGHSRSRSMSQTPSSPVVIKQEDTIQDFNSPHVQHGQKRPFSLLRSERSISEETEVAGPAAERIEDVDYDDPLAGDLDDPDDDMGDDGDDEEDEGMERQNEGSDDTDEDDIKSPTIGPGMRIQLGSKSVKGERRGSTVPGLGTTSKPSRVKKPKMSKDDAFLEGSEPMTVKSARKGKTHQKRASIPRTTTPAVPKKKELSVICNKLLDNFIRKDMYVLFTEPVDHVLVPDYSSVIKNPMDLSTMRAKVERNFYPDIDEFLNDFKLVCDNARLYNSKETLYWRQADKLWEWGSKAIERERKSVLDRDEEFLRAIKDEETVDVGGMGDYGGSHIATTSSGRGHLLSVEGNVDSMGDYGRSHTPQQYRKARKIKHRRDGTIAFTFSTDGSIDPVCHPDPWSLIPLAQDFGSAPLVCPLVESNPNYNGQYLDDYPYWRAPTCAFRPAVFQDYGPYAILGRPTPDAGGASGVQNIPAYTGMVFGDEKGEAYVRSLAMFLDGIVDEKELAIMSNDDAAGLLEVREHVRKKIETLTRGASTIVDKVASVIREEKTGKPVGADTLVPLKLWRQDFTVEHEVVAPTKVEEANISRHAPYYTRNDLLKSIKHDIEMAETDQDRNQEEEDREASEELVKADVQQGASYEDKDDEGETTEEEDQPVKAQKEDTSKWVDIRQILRDIRAWPKVLREKTDYESWRQLKIELDSLLPPSQRTATTAPVTPLADDEFEVKWGQKWSGGDSEEDKIWVQEYLEHNAAEMQQVVHLLVSKSISERSPAASTTTSVAASPAASASATGSPAAISTGSDVQELSLREQLLKSIRTRLAEMVQYVPLSEVNPQRLPPPGVPSAPPASTLAVNTSSSKASAESPIETSSTLATTTALAEAPDSPDDGSVSSLSSPGSSSP